MAEEKQTKDDSKDLDNLLDEALTDFNTVPTSKSPSAIPKTQPSVSSSETAPPPSDSLQKTFEAMCFNDEKFLNELDSLPNVLSNFPFGLGQADENDTDNNQIFNLFSELGKHAELLQKIKDEDIEKALEKLADQGTEMAGTAGGSSSSASASSTTVKEEPHVEQLNMFMSGILSKDVMLPACQAVDESYQEWLNKNNDNLTDEEKQRFVKQHLCVKDICREYETNNNNPNQMQRVLQKFQELQTYGDPPKELLFFPGLPGFGTGAEQNLLDEAFADADKVTQSDAECSVM